MPVVTLGDKSHDRRPGLAQRGDLRVVGRLHAGPAGRAERGELRVPEVQFGAGPLEELGVLGDRPGPATLDEADAELVQPPGDGQLVGDGQGQPFLLGAVAQRGVVDVEHVVGHLLTWSVSVVGARRPGVVERKQKTPRGMREVCASACAGGQP